MTVVYPRKLRNNLDTRSILANVVKDRDIHLATLNRYRYNEQRSCKDLTEVIEKLNGKPKDLVRELSHHVSDEARHAYWLTDLLDELGADLGTPPGISYIDEFERLIDWENQHQTLEDGLINALVAINVTEKRGCEYFSAHIWALKSAPQTEENLKIKATIAKIFPEEAAHVRWGNRWLTKMAKLSPEQAKKVEQAKLKYTAIEQAAYESGMDIMMGAELRRVNHLLEISANLPLWERPQYIMSRLSESLLAPTLQKTRVEVAQRAWKRDPEAFVNRLIPMFFNGLSLDNKKAV